MIRRIPAAELVSEAAPITLAADALRTTLASNRGKSAASAAELTAVLRALLSEELALRPEHIQAVIDRELQKLRRARCIELHVHPEDAARIEDESHRRERLALAGTLTIVASDNIEPGGCVLRSEVGSVDARVETRIELAVELIRAGAFDAP